MSRTPQGGVRLAATAAGTSVAATVDDVRGRAAAGSKIAWLELALVLGVLGADLWYLRGLESPFSHVLAPIVVLFVLVTGGVRRRRRGVLSPPRQVGPLRAWGETALVTVLAVLLLAAIGAAIRVPPIDEVRLFAFAWPLADQARLALTTLIRAALQQVGLHCVVWATLWELSGRERLSLIGAGLVFGLLHMPIPTLAAGAAVAGWMWVVLYRRGRSLTAIVLSHVLIAAAAYAFLPERTLEDLHVGRKALDRSANYKLLETGVRREVLTSVCSGGLTAENDAETTQWLAREILGRPATPAELGRWAPRVSRFSPCTAAKMLVMSDDFLRLRGGGRGAARSSE